MLGGIFTLFVFENVSVRQILGMVLVGRGRLAAEGNRAQARLVRRAVVLGSAKKMTRFSLKRPQMFTKPFRCSYTMPLFRADVKLIVCISVTLRYQ